MLKVRGSGVPVTGPLAGFVEGFLVDLSGLGYSPRSLEGQLRVVRHLSGWLAVEGLAAEDLTGRVVARFVAVRRGVAPSMRSEKALVPLLVYLRGLGAAPDAEPSQPATPAEVVLERFAHYLSVERALAAATVLSYVSQVRPFFVVHPSEEEWSSLNARQVADFVTRRAVGQRARSLQVGANALRVLLRWMWLEEMVATQLAEAVGSVAAPTGTVPPKALTAAEVRAVIGALPASGPARLRNESMLVMMLRLGLRAGEVASLRLEDIAWRTGLVQIRGKGARCDELPLPVDVGELVAAYLRHGRPVGTGHREVFLGLLAPHRPATAVTVSCMAADLMRRADIGGSGAAHRFRHTAACGVLAAGGGLVEAGQLLRHSDLNSTGAYARADVASLALLARPWPTEVSR
jgi:integrase/recombinase XerD